MAVAAKRLARPQPERSPAGARDRVARSAVAAGLTVTAAGLVVAAVLGPLVSDLVDYRVSETLRAQTIGLDAVSLLVVAPLGLTAAVLVVRGRVLGLALGLGIGAFTSYMVPQYVLGPDYAGLPGNNERLFPLWLVLFASAWMVTLAAWAQIETDRLPRSRRRELRIGRVLLPVLAFLAFVRYLPALGDAMRSAPNDAGYLAGPAFFWVIVLLDLGVFLPLTVATCVGLIRDEPWAPRAQYVVAGWFGLVGLAVAAMAVVMYVNDDPAATAAGTAFMTALGAAFALLAAYVYWPLVRSDRAARETGL